MAVLVSDSRNAAYSGNWSTANAWYTGDAHNLSGFHSSTISLSSNRTIPLTFSGVANCVGGVITIGGNLTVLISTLKSVTLKLQEDVAGVWTDRASQTLTASEIGAGATGMYQFAGMSWTRYFKFATPYAIDATASKWRFEVSNATGTNNWDLIVGDSSNNPMYVAVVDTQRTFANNDAVVIADPIEIDSTVTVRGLLGGTHTTYAPGIIVCAGPDMTEANNPMLRCTSPAASYTVTINGVFVQSTGAGIRFGSSGTPIPKTNKLIFQFTGPTNGTVTAWTAYSIARPSLDDRYLNWWVYGEQPTVAKLAYDATHINGSALSFTIASPCVATRNSHNMYNGTPFRITTTGALPTGLSTGVTYWVGNKTTNTFNIYDTYANAIAGGATGRVDTSGSQSGTHTLQSVIITDVSSGWSNGDRIVVAGQDTQGTGDTTLTNTIASISGTEIIPTNGLLATPRRAGFKIANLDGYGVSIRGITTTRTGINQRYANNMQIYGVEFRDTGFQFSTQSGQAFADTTGNQVRWVMKGCVSYWTTIGANTGWTALVAVPNQGLTIDEFYTFGHVFNFGAFGFSVAGWNGIGQESGTLTMQNCLTAMNSSAMMVIGGVGTTFQDNQFSNNNANTVQPIINFGGSSISLIASTIKNNKFIGCGCGPYLTSVINTVEWSGCEYNNCGQAISFPSGITSGVVATGLKFGNITANTTDIYQYQNAFIDTLIDSPTGTLTVSTAQQALTVSGAGLRITNMNGSALDDRTWHKYGFYQRTGTGLSDTTTRTSGGYSIRLQPTSGTNTLNWPNLLSQRAVPTGNIQNRPMTVLAWCYINNTAYDAGTHVMPKLNVKYDNTTTVSATATATFGSWQLLSVTFTPTTTYGQLEVWVSAATDATTSNAYVYFDDVQIQYPSGYSFNLGALDLWAGASPVWPPIATQALAGSVWDEPKSAHTDSGSFGELPTDINNGAVLAGILGK
jgi:hypothetical protein